jgi:hypothetical protein
MGGCLAHHLEALDLTEGTAGFLDGPKPLFVWQVVGAGLQGEEVPLVSLKDLLHFWRELQIGNANKRYMMIMLSGHFKRGGGLMLACGPHYPLATRPTPTSPFTFGWKGSCQGGSTTSTASRGWLFEMRTGARAKFGRYNAKF